MLWQEFLKTPFSLRPRFVVWTISILAYIFTRRSWSMQASLNFSRVRKLNVVYEKLKLKTKCCGWNFLDVTSFVYTKGLVTWSRASPTSRASPPKRVETRFVFTWGMLSQAIGLKSKSFSPGVDRTTGFHRQKLTPPVGLAPARVFTCTKQTKR